MLVDKNILMEDGVVDIEYIIDIGNTDEIVSICVGCDSVVSKMVRAINRQFNIKQDFECVNCLADTLEMNVEEILDTEAWVLMDKRKCLWDD